MTNSDTFQIQFTDYKTAVTTQYKIPLKIINDIETTLFSMIKRDIKQYRKQNEWIIINHLIEFDYALADKEIIEKIRTFINSNNIKSDSIKTNKFKINMYLN